MKKVIAFAVACLMMLSLVTVVHAADDVYVEIKVGGADPYFNVAIDGGIDPTKAVYAVVRYNLSADSAIEGQIFPAPATGPHVNYGYETDGNWHTAVVELSELAGERWDVGFRFDVLADSEEGMVIKFAWVAFTETTPGDDFDPTTANYYVSAENLYVAANGANRNQILDVQLIGASVKLDDIVNFAPTRGAGDPHSIQGLSEGYAMKITVPEGQALKSFTWVGAPTWSNPDPEESSVTVEVYAWDTDYDTTVIGQLVETFDIDSHADNSDLVLNFSKRPAGNTYLILVTSTGSQPIGFWDGAMADGMEAYDFQGFSDGFEVDYIPQSVFVLTDASEMPTPEPTEVPTEAPAATPTTEPTAKAPATEPPAEPTDAPAESGGCGSVIGGGIAILAVVSAAALVLRKKEH